MAGSGLQPAIIAILFLFPALATSIVAVRFWRRILDRSFAGEDVVLAAAMGTAIAYAFVSYAEVKANYEGYYEVDVPLKDIDFDKVAKVVNGIYMVGSTLASILACLPIEKNFDRRVPGSCYDVQAYVIASVCIVIATDIMVIAVPPWMIYDLHMPLLRKAITISFLSFGLAVTAIGCVRLEYIVRLFIGREYTRHTLEYTYSTLESNLAIIGACGPTVKWVLARCFPFLELSHKTSTYNNNSVPGFNSSAISRAQRGTRLRLAEGSGDGDSGSRRRLHDCHYVSTMPKDDNDAVELRNGDALRHQGGDTDGILKTVEWDLRSRDRSNVSVRGGGNAVRPNDVV